MKRTSKILAVVLFAALSLFAQDVAKPKFQGFNAGFAKFGAMESGYRQFELRVDYDPFHFVAKGLINAGTQTTDLDILGDQLAFAISYFDTPFKDTKGNPQVVSLSEISALVGEDRAKIKDVTFELLPPTNTAQGRAGLKSAEDKQAAYLAGVSAELRASSEDEALTRAFADPMNKANKEHEAQKKQMALEKATQDSLVAAQAAQASQDSIAVAAKASKSTKKKKKAAPVVVAEVQPAPAPVDATIPAAAVANEDQTTSVDNAPSQDDDQPVVPVKKKKKKKVHSDEAALNQSSAPSDSLGFVGSGENRKKLGIGLAVLGGILAVYAVYEHTVINNHLTDIQAIENGQAPGFTPTSQHYIDLQNEKAGATTNQNLALVLAALSIGGSIVLIRF